MLTLKRVSYEDFDTYSLPHSSGNFHQTSKMGIFREAMGWDVHPLLIKDQDLTIGAILLAGKTGRYETTMGPLFDFSDASKVHAMLDAITIYAKELKATQLEIYPNEVYQTRNSSGAVDVKNDTQLVKEFTDAGWKHKGFTTEYDLVANRWLFVKDLSGLKDSSDLLASYRQTTRQTVKKLIAKDYSIKKMSYDELDVVKKLVDSSYEKNQVSVRPLEYYQKMYKAFGDSVEFLVVYYKGKTPISTGVFISHPSEMVYFMSGADTEYRHLYGGHYLQHYVMSECIKKGITRYNFYGVSGKFTNNPLLVYKSGFRGYIEEYVGGFYKVINRRKAMIRKARNLAGRIRRGDI